MIVFTAYALDMDSLIPKVDKDTQIIDVLWTLRCCILGYFMPD